jgi:hypothetical protein
MRKYGSLIAIFVSVLLFGAFGIPGSAASTSDGLKLRRESAPTGSAALRQRLKKRDKVATTEKTSAARLAQTLPVAVGTRVEQFKGRVNRESENRELAPNKRGARTRENSPRMPAAKEAARGGTVRGGTGTGDIFEDEPNDVDAQVIHDVPVNIVGAIDEPGDIDYFAVPVTSGESVRVEIVADRIFGSALDSFVTVLRDDTETEIASNDDGFSNSGDSFLRLTAPYSGYVFIGVTDTLSFGGSDYDYILNVVVASTPDLSEVEPNDAFNQADVVNIPGVIFGFADFTDDLDTYVFDGIEGETLVVDIDAEVFLSDMDAVVQLDDDREGFLFINDDTDGLDPRFNIVLPYTGTYYLTVTDRLGETGDNFYYTLNLSTQSGALAPRVNGAKITSDGFLKRVLGSGFDRNGARAELNSERIASGPGPRKPTTVVRVRPAVEVFTNDILTVVNPDQRRSNPGIVP